MVVSTVLVKNKDCPNSQFEYEVSLLTATPRLLASTTSLISFSKSFAVLKFIYVKNT